MIKLTSSERKIANQISLLKDASGSHSPSIITVCEKIPEIKVKVDACFLSNPYATDLFLKHLKEELIDTDEIRDVLEYYPSQNEVIAEVIANFNGVSKENVMVGNGAIELIQAIIQRFVDKKIVINIPTFSSYYEFVEERTKVIYYQLKKNNNYELDVDEYINFIKINKPDSIVIINPNNPNGGYIKYQDLRKILINLKHLKNIIIDESFLHFAYEDEDYTLISATDLFKEFSNVIVIKSMSKDFGIAGIRAGYAIMDKYKVSKLLSNGYLWNSSGLAEYFFRLYNKKDFFSKYLEVRSRYINETGLFFRQLRKIKGIKVYPSMANFALIELVDGSSASDFVSKMLIKYGIYVRIGSDKIGLNGEFVRIAARTSDENSIIIDALKNIFEVEDRVEISNF